MNQKGPRVIIALAFFYNRLRSQRRLEFILSY